MKKERLQIIGERTSTKGNKLVSLFEQGKTDLVTNAVVTAYPESVTLNDIEFGCYVDGHITYKKNSSFAFIRITSIYRE